MSLLENGAYAHTHRASCRGRGVRGRIETTICGSVVGVPGPSVGVVTRMSWVQPVCEPEGPSFFLAA